MFIASVRLTSFKCFRDTPEIHFWRGINLITGRNNAGKSALLEALNLKYSNAPHVPVSPATTIQPSSFEYTVELSGEELRQIIRSIGRANIRIPAPNEALGNNPAAYLLGRQTLQGRYRVDQNEAIVAEYQRPFGAYQGGAGFFVWLNDGTDGVATQAPHVGATDLLQHVFQIYRARVYRCVAERLNVGQCAMRSQDLLEANAANLADVLHTLQSRNKRRFERFNELVSRVLPEVKWIDVVSVGESQLMIRVWSHDPATEYQQAAFPLSQSGTGVGQVLAMLYILINSDPATIIIDEPNSFLHPGAVRTLIEIFRESSDKHQFILTTHSAAVITQAEPLVIHLLRRGESETTIEQIDRAKVSDLRNCLDELGAGLSEVFGAESVLWVEGPTEERCFPLIRDALPKRPARSCVIVSVKRTGDFARRTAKHSFEIYEQLTKSSALVPPALAYVFDRDGRSDTERRDLERASNGRVHFLLRRCYENYLIDHDAIAAVLNSLSTFASQPIDPEVVRQWIETKRGPGPEADLWLVEGDGAKLLSELFSELSQQEQEYNKIAHGQQLTAWILQNRRHLLDDLSALIGKILD